MIECTNVSKRFRSVNVLDQMNLQIRKDTIVGLVGRNGAGKTTLLKLITGCWRPSTGEVHVLGERPFDSLFVSTNSIFVDDDMIFPEVLSLGELREAYAGFYPNWDVQLASRLCSYFQLSSTSFYYELSKGKKSTFNAIVGLCSRAPLTIFDEPTTGMDRSVRQDFYKALLKDYMEFPRTIIISSHHIEEVEHILEDLILIDAGKLLLHLPIDDVREYARGVRGNKEEIRSWSKDKEVLYEEEVGVDELFIIVKNNRGVAESKHGNFTVSAVTAADLAVYLTKGKKGAIDDVFN